MRLVARLGPVLYVIGTVILLGQLVSKPEWAGLGFIAIGSLFTILTKTEGFLETGDLLLLASTGIYAITMLMSERLLPEIGLPALMFMRNLFSALVFFIIANVLFGPAHFGHAFYGPLWVIMGVYGLIIIVAAQLAWYHAIENLPPANIAKWAFLTPILGVTYAYFLNSERPSSDQIVALGFISIGLVVANIGSFFSKRFFG